MATRQFLSVALVLALVGCCAAKRPEPATVATEPSPLAVTKLEAWFRAMLQVQESATVETKRLDSLRAKRPWTREEIKSLRQLADQELVLSNMARVALEQIRNDGTTVVFPKIVENLWEDLERTHHLLRGDAAAKPPVSADTGEDTQQLQRDIEETLRDLITAATPCGPY